MVDAGAVLRHTADRGTQINGARLVTFPERASSAALHEYVRPAASIMDHFNARVSSPRPLRDVVGSLNRRALGLPWIAASTKVRLAKAINWQFLEEQFGTVYTDGAERPPLPTRLMAGLAILKHTYNLSDEAVCALWVEYVATQA